MTLFKRALAVLLPSFLASFTAAQIPTGTFSHIIIVVQENRTPDNLFGIYATSPCTGSGYSLPGADLVNGGTNIGNGTGSTCNATFAMNSNNSPMHENADWKAGYDGGKMDGFCDTMRDGYQPPCPTYSNVRLTDVAPYFSIATNYGFANYMFQSNEGPRGASVFVYRYRGACSPEHIKRLLEVLRSEQSACRQRMPGPNRPVLDRPHADRLYDSAIEL